MARYVDEMITRFSVEGANTLTGAFQRGGESAKSFADKHAKLLDNIGYLAPYAQAAGDRIVGLSNQMLGAYQNAQLVDQQLESMYKVKGFSPEQLASAKRLATELQNLGGVNDEASKHAIALMASFNMKPGQMEELLPYMASQAALTGSSIDAIASAVGKAFGSGQYGMLSRFGITLDQTARAALVQATAMQKSGDAAEKAAGDALGYDTILKALRDNVPPLGDRLQTLQGQQERFNATLDDFYEKTGAGVSELHAWAYALGYDALSSVMNMDEGTAKLTGKIMYLGGYALKAAGSAGAMYRDYRMLTSQLQIAAAVTGKQAAATRGLAVANRAAAVSGNAMALSLSTIGATALVAAAAIAAAYLVYRDYQVIAETQGELQNVREGNDAIAAQAEDLRRRGMEGSVAGVEERGWWGNLLASWKSDWSDEDTTSVAPGGRRRQATGRRNARGDLQISIPGAGYSHQQVSDYVNLQGK